MREPEPVVFVVDDDPSIRDALTNLLRSVGLGVATFGSAREFLTDQRPDAPGCLVLDVRLPGLSGLDLQRELAAAQIDLPIIFITGHGDIPMTVRAMKAGAVERGVRSPIIDLTLWDHRVFTSALLSLTLAMLPLFAVSFLLPFYFEALRGFSVATSGVLLTPLPLTIAIVAPLSRGLADRLGSRGLAAGELGALQRTCLGSFRAALLTCAACAAIGIGTALVRGHERLPAARLKRDNA